MALKITPVRGEVPPSGNDLGYEDDGLSNVGFRIDEQTVPSAETDTGRMLAAGARRVFWLRATRENIGAGVEAFLKMVPDRACLVVEGNSARRFVEPGLFILLRDKREADEKESYAALVPLADRIATLDGAEWDFSPEECLFIDGGWMLRPRASAVLLAGGDSRRMGRDKGLLPIGEKPMIAHIVDRLKALFDDILVAANRPGDYAFLGAEIVSDRAPGCGPLMGIASALPRTKNDLNFVMACDIPEFDPGFISRLATQAAGFDAVLPINARGELEPVFAFYRKSVVESARAILASGGRSILDLLPRIRWRSVPIPDGIEIRNINTADDYASFKNGR